MSLPSLLHPIEKICNQLPTSGIYVAQPCGKLCYAWFTDVCTIIDRTTKKQWTVAVTFDSCLSGTIVSGILLPEKLFVIDNVFHYKSAVLQCSYPEKIKVMKQMLVMHIRPGYFFLPSFSTEASYKIHNIKIVQDDVTYHYTPKPKTTKAFQVRSTSKSDIYEVYKNNQLDSIACIDTYSCSQAMNKLFHPTDTFVEKTITMECTWNETFKKWTPIKPVSS